MKKPAARSTRYCDRHHKGGFARARRLWRLDMMDALRDIIEGEAVENQWAKERVQALFGMNARTPEPPDDEMAIDLGGVKVTVRGKGLALVLAPGLKPGQQDQPGISGD